MKLCVYESLNKCMALGKSQKTLLCNFFICKRRIKHTLLFAEKYCVDKMNITVNIKAFWKLERDVEIDCCSVTVFIDIKENSKPPVFLILLLLDTSVTSLDS